MLPGVELRVGEAAVLPLDAAVFDAVFFYGVFLYFPDLTYAVRVLDEMLRTARPRAPLLIMDIFDEGRREECEAARRSMGAQAASSTSRFRAMGIPVSASTAFSRIEDC